jgi:DNA invertase Pin-like site-specific DNA recombinase
MRSKRVKCSRICQEKASGAKAERQELMKLLDNARKGDAVIAGKLDRLARFAPFWPDSHSSSTRNTSNALGMTSSGF